MKNGVSALPAAVRDELLTLYSAGNWGRLAIAADSVTARYPKNPFCWKASGKAFLQMGKLPEAIDRLTKVVKLAPGDADARNDLGSALRDVGRLQDAVASFQRAVQLNPRVHEAHSNLGRALCDLGQFEESAASCRRAIDIAPDSVIAHNNLGNALSAMGRSSEAEASYRQALAIRPGYLEALINLGIVLGELGRWAEAKAVHRLAVQIHPQAGVAYNALGRLLSRLCEDDEEAMRSLQRAIALNAFDTNTYAELGNILMRQRRPDAALAMFRRARDLQPLITWPANQERAEFSALFLDTPMGGSTPVNYLAGRACYDRHFHCVIPDTAADIDLLRSKADVVFNMISNVDDGRDVLLLALKLVESLGLPTVNHPRAIMDTDRETVARRLSVVPGCVVPRTIRVPGPVVEKAASNGGFEGFRLPLLVRVAGTHGGDDFDKFGNWVAIADFGSQKPAANYYLTEYIDYRSDDGLFRKYRVIFIDGEILPYHLAIHNDWKVHHFRTDMTDHLWMREEEERFLDGFGGVFGPAQQETLRTMAKVTGLDYGGIDCGIDRDGQIVMFEANATMLVHDEKTVTFAYKNKYIARVKDAFDRMLSRRRVSG